MQTTTINNDVTVFYVNADSFPEGVKQAWEKLHLLLPSPKERSFYGLSHGNKNGGITYKAAVEVLKDGEAERYGCETYIIPKGEYLSETIVDYMNKIEKIGMAFQQLLAHPDFDGVTPCVEWYKNDNEVVCMVKKSVKE